MQPIIIPRQAKHLLQRATAGEEMGLSIKMSQLGHYETIRTFGNAHWERTPRAKSRENDVIYLVLGYTEGCGDGKTHCGEDER